MVFIREHYISCSIYLRVISLTCRLVFPIGDGDVVSQDRERISSKFDRMSDSVIQGCLGAADGPVMKIQNPTKSSDLNTQDMRNRKGYYSFVFQVICDSDRIFYVSAHIVQLIATSAPSK